VKELRAVGLFPDVIVCRANNVLTAATKEKIAQFCHVPSSKVLSVHNVENTYHVPLILRDQKIVEIIFDQVEKHPMFCMYISYPYPCLFLFWFIFVFCLSHISHYIVSVEVPH
jgi:CTP synthase (UTP-ammonia lyase)